MPSMRKRALFMDEALAILDEESEENEVLDLVLLPPDGRDGDVSDEEQGDEDNLTSTNEVPKKVSGLLEIHTNIDRPPSHALSRRRDLLKWCDQADCAFDDSAFQNLIPLSNRFPSLVDEDPIKIFQLFFDEKMVQLIIEESNRYARQQNDQDFQLTEEDVDKFIGILMLSGYHSLPRQHMYWSKQEDLEVPIVANAMSRSRFVAIKKYFHFADNQSLAPGDKIAKIRPLYDNVNRVLERFGPYEKDLSIDEQMVPYYGRYSCKMFINGKPIRFGFKNWVLATASGYPVRIEMHIGKDEVEQRDPNGLGPNVVLELLRSVTNPAFHNVFIDSFFTSYDLMTLLSEKGFRCTGTARDNLLLNCPLPNSKTIDKAKIGTYWSRSDGKILVVKWKDNKAVTVVTNFDMVEPLQQCARWSKTEKKHVFVEQPSLIKASKSSIGGVDLLDQAVANYRPTIAWKKWYGSLIINCFSVLRVAAWKIHKSLGGKLDQLSFCRAVVLQLLKNPRRAVARPGPQRQITRVLRKPHRIEHCGRQERCDVCKRYSRMKCKRCNVWLHNLCSGKFHQ